MLCHGASSCTSSKLGDGQHLGQIRITFLDATPGKKTHQHACRLSIETQLPPGRQRVTTAKGTAPAACPSNLSCSSITDVTVGKIIVVRLYARWGGGYDRRKRATGTRQMIDTW